MKKIYILGILAFLILAVGCASATTLTLEKTNGYDNLGVIINVNYNPNTGAFTFEDATPTASGWGTTTGCGIRGVAFAGQNIWNVITISNPTNFEPYDPGQVPGYDGFSPFYIGAKKSQGLNIGYEVVQGSLTSVSPNQDLVANGKGYFCAVDYRYTNPTTGYSKTFFVTNGPTTPTTPIPEFPTVALPVAAILGLMLILGRRNKE